MNFLRWVLKWLCGISERYNHVNWLLKKSEGRGILGMEVERDWTIMAASNNSLKLATLLCVPLNSER